MKQVPEMGLQNKQMKRKCERAQLSLFARGVASGSKNNAKNRGEKETETPFFFSSSFSWDSLIQFSSLSPLLSTSGKGSEGLLKYDYFILFWSFQGQVCANPCPPGTFGLSCKDRCDCYNGALCDHVSGECRCLPGFQGDKVWFFL